MTKKLTVHALALLIAFAGVGISSTHASEVTGTLSSGVTGAAGSSSGADGSLSGTVTGGGGTSGSGGGGSRRSSGNGGGSSSSPAGEVLGAQISQAVTPTFPNAGADPEEEDAPWEDVTLMGALGTLFALAALQHKRRTQQ